MSIKYILNFKRSFIDFLFRYDIIRLRVYLKEMVHYRERKTSNPETGFTGQFRSPV